MPHKKKEETEERKANEAVKHERIVFVWDIFSRLFRDEIEGNCRNENTQKKKSGFWRNLLENLITV